MLEELLHCVHPNRFRWVSQAAKEAGKQANPQGHTSSNAASCSSLGFLCSMTVRVPTTLLAGCGAEYNGRKKYSCGRSRAKNSGGRVARGSSAETTMGGTLRGRASLLLLLLLLLLSSSMLMSSKVSRLRLARYARTSRSFCDCSCCGCCCGWCCCCSSCEAVVVDAGVGVPAAAVLFAMALTGGT